MHFIAEPANHNNKPSQCYKCFKYGHIAKYCKADNQICSRCAGENHKYDNCPNSNKHPICCNCKGEHTATSSDCPKFKEHQQKIQKTIDKYSSPTPVCPNWNNYDEFPILKSTDKVNQIPIIETITEKIMLAVEQATRRIFETLNQKFEILINQLGKKLNIEIEEICIDTENNPQQLKSNKKTTIVSHQIEREQPTEEMQGENSEPTLTPINGTKRKYLSPSSASDKSSNTIIDSKIL
jgi:hypothetical protein